MNCHDVAALLDANRLDTIAPDQRAGIDAHANSCAECSSAIRAQRALSADPVPPPPAMDVRALLAAHRAQPRAKRPAAAFALRPIVVGALAAGGAAFAALGLLSVGGPDEQARSEHVAAEASSAASQSASEDGASAAAAAAQLSLIDYVEEAESAAADAFREELMSGPQLPDGEYFPLLKVAPVFPTAAVQRALEGHAIVEFTVTANGDVADPFIVESSDPVFREPTLEAVGRFKYKPRVIEGRAVDVQGVRNRFTYALEHHAAAE